MNLYTPDGWLDIDGILSCGQPFIFVVGGRGTGKTYGALKRARERSIIEGRRFMLLRRLQSQVDLVNKPEYSPFKSIDRDHNYLTASRPLSKYTAGFYEADRGEDGNPIPKGPCIGYTAALSTISNMRGFDASDVDLIVYDEFIPESHERPLKDEAAALFNAYETVNRNRELNGRPPAQLLCLANANDLGNPVFLSLGLVNRAEQMRSKGREVWIDVKRGICLIILQKSPIGNKKRNTALYRLTGGTEFSEMALDNSFSGEERSRVHNMPLKEFNPIVQVGEICIYRHKSEGGLYYVSTHTTGSPPSYGAGPVDLQRFRTGFQWLYQQYMLRHIVFEQYSCEILFKKYFS